MSAKKAIRTIVVPLDGSETGERAIPWAKAVAGSDARIVLMEVTPVASTVRTIGGQVIGTAETIQEGYRQMAEQQLNDSRGRWFERDDKVETVVASGDPGEQIMAVAADHAAELIVMSSHGRGAIGRFVSGSVADRVVRHSSVPVMIVGPEGEPPSGAKVQRVIAPIENSELSLAALPIARAISSMTGAPISVINVVLPTTDYAYVYPGAMGTLPPAAFDGMFEQAVSEANALIDRVISSLKNDGFEATGEVYTGSAARSIMDALRPGDVIVLSSHARQGLSRWVIGSTSMKLIRNGQAPVVIVTRESIEQAGQSPQSRK